MHAAPLSLIFAQTTELSQSTALDQLPGGTVAYTTATRLSCQLVNEAAEARQGLSGGLAGRSDQIGGQRVQPDVGVLGAAGQHRERDVSVDPVEADQEAFGLFDDWLGGQPAAQPDNLLHQIRPVGVGQVGTPPSQSRRSRSCPSSFRQRRSAQAAYSVWQAAPHDRVAPQALEVATRGVFGNGVELAAPDATTPQEQLNDRQQRPADRTGSSSRPGPSKPQHNGSVAPAPGSDGRLSG